MIKIAAINIIIKIEWINRAFFSIFFYLSISFLSYIQKIIKIIKIIKVCKYLL